MDRRAMTLDEALYGATCEFVNKGQYTKYTNQWILNSEQGNTLTANIDNLERFHKNGGWYKIYNINLSRFNIWLKEQYDDSPFPV